MSLWPEPRLISTWSPGTNFCSPLTSSLSPARACPSWMRAIFAFTTSSPKLCRATLLVLTRSKCCDSGRDWAVVSSSQTCTVRGSRGTIPKARSKGAVPPRPRLLFAAQATRVKSSSAVAFIPSGRPTKCASTR